jgi:hypothetical protein
VFANNDSVKRRTRRQRRLWQVGSDDCAGIAAASIEIDLNASLDDELRCARVLRPLTSSLDTRREAGAGAALGTAAETLATVPIAAAPPGIEFHVSNIAHDNRAIGRELAVSLLFLGADQHEASVSQPSGDP